MKLIKKWSGILDHTWNAVKKGLTTNFVEKRRQPTVTKTKKWAEYESKCMRKKRGNTKRKKSGKK